jgi:hypothetical protein
MTARSPVGIAVYGIGKMGQQLIRDSHASTDLSLKAGITTDPSKDAKDLGELAGMAPLGIQATRDLVDVLGRRDVDLVFYCGLGGPSEVADILGAIAETGTDAITLTGLIHPAAALGAEQAERLAKRAAAGRARVVGAGWNPGFLLDVLPVMWGTSSIAPTRIFAQRIAEMRDWGEGVHEECGIGFAPEDVTDTNSNPLHESVAVIADGLSISLEAIENHHRPYVSTIRRSHGDRTVEPGKNAGFHKRALGIRDGRAVIEVEMYAIFCIDPTVDGRTEGARVEISGDTTIDAQVSGNWFGDSYPVTAARAIRAVRPLRTLAPGLYRPDQLPLSG